MRDYRPDIDGLRAVAVGLILLFHLGSRAVPGGFVGVDVFFVISGYLITKLILDELRDTGSFRFGAFYVRRARRLLPALFTTLAATAIGSALYLSPESLETFGASLVHASVSLSNIFFWRQAGYFDADAITKPLLHTWSLGVEEQFYLIWPLFLTLIARSRRWPVAVTSILLAGLASVCLNLVFVNGDPTTMFYLLPFRIYEFAIGALMVWMAAKPTTRPIAMELMLAAGLGLIGVSAVMFDEHVRFPGYAALVPCLGTALVIYAGKAPIVGRLLANPISRGVGLISYSLYLVHWPVIVLWRYRTLRPLDIGEQLLITACCVAIAAAMYRFVEQPFRTPGTAQRDARLPPTRFGLQMLAGLTIVLAIGASQWTGRGWPWRFSGELRTMLAFKYDYHAYFRQGTCYLDIEQSHDMMPPECFTPPGNGLPNILIVGDSHAAHLWLGFERELKGRANVLQYTHSLCPTIAGVDVPNRPYCRPFNDYLLSDVLRRHHYDLIIMASRYGDYGSPQFAETKARLAAIGTPYVLFGELIEYAAALPDLVTRHGQVYGLEAFLRANMAVPCDAPEVRRSHVEPASYFSPRSAFCRNGHLLFQRDGNLFVWDYGHLTEIGSRVLARAFIEQRGELIAVR